VKYLNKLMLFSLFMLVSVSGRIAAYVFTITNETGQNVKVRLHYAFGKLNKQDDLIMAGDTRTFSFGGIKKGLCLSKIMVSTEQAGEWLKPKKAEKEYLRKDGTEMDAGTRADMYLFSPWAMSMCRSRHLFLRVDLETGEIRTVVEFNK